MFRGRFEISIDGKGRINVPSKLRDHLTDKYDDRLIITNFDNCLLAYPFVEWNILEEKFLKMSMLKKEHKAFLRFFMSGATECTLDKQGRILIPPVLRDYAALGKDLVVTGMLNKFEIWSKERWEGEFEEASNQNFEDMADALSDMGI